MSHIRIIIITYQNRDNFQKMKSSNSNTKTGPCFKCSFNLTIPSSQCLAQCPQCGRFNIFLCHIIPKPPPSSSPSSPSLSPFVSKISCPTCSSSYRLICCPKCNGYCGIKDFISGYAYQCTCGIKYQYLECGGSEGCGAMLAIPFGKNYQKTKIKCRSCGRAFRYKNCGNCRTCVYKSADDTSQIYLCSNSSCPQSGTGKQGLLQNPYFLPESSDNELNNRISQFEQQAKNQKLQFKDACKVCIDRQAIMINTNCYHLALCQTCAQEIEKKREGECPICRAKGGYQKVFKP